MSVLEWLVRLRKWSETFYFCEPEVVDSWKRDGQYAGFQSQS